MPLIALLASLALAQSAFASVVATKKAVFQGDYVNAKLVLSTTPKTTGKETVLVASLYTQQTIFVHVRLVGSMRLGPWPAASKLVGFTFTPCHEAAKADITWIAGNVTHEVSLLARPALFTVVPRSFPC